MEILRININNGRGEFVVKDGFFPTTQTRFKALLKIIMLVDDVEDKIQHLQSLKSHLENKIFNVDNYYYTKKGSSQEKKSLQNCLKILNEKYSRYFNV